MYGACNCCQRNMHARRADGRSRVVSSFFFFQAEDGIRDLTVTGVQTCALPISDPQSKGEDDGEREPGTAGECAERVAEITHISTPPSDRPSSPAGPGDNSPREIGRASCRERV